MFKSYTVKLSLQAMSRNIRLIVMPQGMSKRALNSTQYRPKTDLILWRLHIVFIINNTYTPCMILKPENSNNQNSNFTEYDPSSSLMSLKGKNIILIFIFFRHNFIL